MTSASSFCKLLWENIKRRAWAAALLMMVFFFALPVNLSLVLENAENTQYRQYNDWEPLVLDGTLTEAEYHARVLECKTGAVVGELQFGNGLPLNHGGRGGGSGQLFLSPQPEKGGFLPQHPCGPGDALCPVLCGRLSHRGGGLPL